MRTLTMLLVLCVAAGMVFGVSIGQSKSFGNVQIRTSLNNRTVEHSTKDVTVWSLDENFDESSVLPFGWTSVDGDGDGQSWFIYSHNTYSGDNCAGSIYNASGNNDWLITPPIHINDGDTLYCWYASQDPDWCNEHIQILISTGTSDTSDFADTIFDYITPDTSWRQFVYGLEDYAGDDIYVAFRNIATDMFILKVDDVKIGQRPTNDCAVEAIDTLSPYLDPGDEVTPAATIYNEGSSSMSPDVICYIIHSDDTIYTDTVTVSELGHDLHRDVTFPAHTLDLYDAVYKIAFEISDATDEVEDNNTSSYYVYTYTTPRTVFFQEFTATGCYWCPYVAITLHQIKIDLADSVAVASYHIWGSYYSDEFATDENDNIAGGYGVDGIPSTVCNGLYEIGGADTNLTRQYDTYLNAYNDIRQLPTPLILDFTISSATATGFDVSTNFEAVGELIDDIDYRLHYVIIETNMPYHWGLAIPLDSLFDVVRATLPNYDGVAVSGSTFTDEEHFDIDPSWNADNCYLIAFVQDGTNGEIFYSKEAKILPSGITEKTDIPEKFALSCNPNPFNSASAIKVNIPKNGQIKLTIYDIKGNMVETIADGEFSAGAHTFRWDGNDDNGNSLSTGIYFVRLDTENSTIVRKIALIK